MSPSLRPISAQRYGRALRRRISPPASIVPVVQHPERPSLPDDFHVRDERITGPQVARQLTQEALDFWWTEDVKGGLTRLCATVENAPTVLAALLRLAERESLAVEQRHRRTNALLESSTRAALQTLTTDRFVRLVLQDMRSAAPPMTVSVEAWATTPEGHLSSPNNNPFVSRIWQSTADAIGGLEGSRSMADLIGAPTTETVPFEVDWVFSWVDGSDPHWQELFAQWAPEEASDASDRSRFVTRDDLKFALRSLELYAPWVRRIHVLTNCRPPAWLDTDHPKINWVDHSEVFEPEHLPTFSSHAIESVVHRIPGLAEHFVYSNDDFFLTRATEPSDFFHASGIARLRLEAYGIVNGPPTPGDPDYLNGARNAAALLTADFGRTPVRLHTHSPQSMNSAVLFELEERYAAEFAQTRGNRFRESTDLAVTGFLYSHYAFLTGRAVPDGGQTLLIQQNHRYARLFSQLLAAQDTGQASRYLSICVNDGRGSLDNSDWDTQARTFLQTYFTERSSFER